MSKLMRSSLLASLKALEEAGIETPEAIVTGTAMGCLANSEQLLVKMIEEGEVSMSPTLFMQSTHNTISSNIAIHLGCHGYNTTYTQDEDSLSWALRDARQLLEKVGVVKQCWWVVTMRLPQHIRECRRGLVSRCTLRFIL